MSISMEGCMMIDWGQVKSLQNDVGHDEFDEIVELFLEEVESIVEKLRKSPNISELENDMHSLKGSALNLGFKAFSQMCLSGEKMAAAGKADLVDLTAIVACFDLSKAKFMSNVSTELQA
jgi:HPt (histidine-containing phosphotransfer) domain-containing protein